MLFEFKVNYISIMIKFLYFCWRFHVNSR